MRRNVIIAIIAAVVVLVVAFFVWRSRPAPKTIQESAAGAIASGDLAQCDSMDQIANGVNYRTVCRNNIFNKQALNNLDIGACSNLDNVLMSIDDCERSVITGLAQKADSVDVCNSVPSALNQFCKDTYWNFTAIKQDKLSLCRNSSMVLSCEAGFLNFFATHAASTSFACADFSEAVVRNDCLNFRKGRCSSIISPPLNQACLNNR